MKTKVLGVVFLAAAVVGCSSADEPAGGAAAATKESAPRPPTVDEVAKMDGSLHVTWKNADSSCDSVEGERQAKMADGSIMEKYKVVFTVPGDVDNKHDTSASDDMEYTYRLRCKKGATYSPYSNELSKNPK
jgi:hypothetical protein